MRYARVTYDDGSSVMMPLDGSEGDSFWLDEADEIVEGEFVEHEHGFTIGTPVTASAHLTGGHYVVSGVVVGHSDNFNSVVVQIDDDCLDWDAGIYLYDGFAPDQLEVIPEEEQLEYVEEVATYTLDDIAVLLGVRRDEIARDLPPGVAPFYDQIAQSQDEALIEWIRDNV